MRAALALAPPLATALATALALPFALAACTAADGGPRAPLRGRLDEAEGSPQAVGREVELIAFGAHDPPGPALDAPPATRVAFRMPDGSLRPVDREAIAFVARWRRGAALIDPARRLYEVRPDGARRMLAAGAVGPLATSADRELLAYVVHRDVFSELRISDGRGERTLVRRMASVGVLRFAPDGRALAFVGARPGGVVGVFVADVVGGGARCLTSCELRTGQPFGAPRLPPPSDPSLVRFEDGALVWIDPAGESHRASLPGDPR